MTVNPFLLSTKTLPKKPKENDKLGYIINVSDVDFPILAGKNITTFVAEIYHEAMRVPHWHPNAAELGYVVSGKMNITLWASPGEAATVFTVSVGQMWFIPRGALHCLNSLLDEPLSLLLSFDSTSPGNIEESLAWDAIPVPILKSMVKNPHDALLKWREKASVTENYIILPNPRREGLPLPKDNLTTSFRIDLKAVTPLVSLPNTGDAIWVRKDNWPILSEANMAMLRGRSSPNTALDPIWWPDNDSLFYIISGRAEWMILDNTTSEKVVFDAKKGDLVFVPRGFLYTYRNLADKEYIVLQTFNSNLPTLPISLAVATYAMPVGTRNDALWVPGEKGTKIPPCTDVFSNLKNPIISPFFLKIKNECDSE